MASGVTVIGGGLAGLINAILLTRAGIEVTLIEKKRYPFHRVCGEYISNEVVPFLNRHGLYPVELNPVPIHKFRLSSIGANTLEIDLDLGGFGISRFDLDHWLVKKAMASGVQLLEETTVDKVIFEKGNFLICTHERGDFTSPLVIGAFGKKSKLDHSLDRNFTHQRYPFIGVKYHIRTKEVAPDTIELHNFEGGYCGISRVKGDTYNLCYLSSRDHLRRYGSIEKMENHVLKKNNYLKQVLENADRLFDKPVVINEITFEKKEVVKDHILMSGDAAGMITPLCGNGMAMAIHSAKILSDLIIKYYPVTDFIRENLENEYVATWNQTFRTRHWTGRKIQSLLFGSRFSSAFAVMMGRSLPSVATFLVRQTHGQPF